MNEIDILKDVVAVLENHNIMIKRLRKTIIEVDQGLANIKGIVEQQKIVPTPQDEGGAQNYFKARSVTINREHLAEEIEKPKLSFDQTIALAGNIAEVAIDIDRIFEELKRVPHPCIDDVIQKAIKSMNDAMEDFHFHAVIAASRLRINAMAVKKSRA